MFCSFKENHPIRNGVSLNNTSIAKLKYDSNLPDIRCIINIEVNYHYDFTKREKISETISELLPFDAVRSLDRNVLRRLHLAGVFWLLFYEVLKLWRCQPTIYKHRKWKSKYLLFKFHTFQVYLTYTSNRKTWLLQAEGISSVFLKSSSPAYCWKNSPPGR